MLIDYAEEDFVDYDSDGELGILKLADVDPYAGLSRSGITSYRF
jgi:hypothetical protein